MKPGKMSLVVPILLMTLGSGWLFSTLGVAPGIDWIWTLGLAVAGVMTFVVGGFDKVTVVIGPFFLVASCMSVLRQTNRLHVDVEVPSLVIIVGLLLLIARSAAVPPPRWIDETPGGAK